MTQVVIIGAGPTGAVMAWLLARNGISVKLIEASSNFQRKFRGEGLMPSGLDALSQMKLLHLVEQIPHQPIDAWEFIIEDRSLFRVAEPLESRGSPCTTVSQPHLLPKIIAQASTQACFEFIQGDRVIDIQYASSRVNGVKLASGAEIPADLVIGADGRSSLIRKKVGIKLQELQQKIDILWFKLDGIAWEQPENVFYSIVRGENAFGLFRGSSGQLHLGWGLHQGQAERWQDVDWLNRIASVAPSWLAESLVQNPASLVSPQLLSVLVGRGDRWWIPGLLLLGDAVHPMSPIRAQGINMAFRDAMVAANHLVPLLGQSEIEPEEIDAALNLIQLEREPEIKLVQKLQAQEMAQAELLHSSAILRWGVKTFAPVLSPAIRFSWLRRQRQLRQGVTEVKLTV